MTLYFSSKFKLAASAALAFLLLAGCKTTPMYHEGDVHLEDRCPASSLQACGRQLQKICTEDYEGYVTDYEVINKKGALQLLHLTCLPKEPRLLRSRTDDAEDSADGGAADGADGAADDAGDAAEGEVEGEAGQ